MSAEIGWWYLVPGSRKRCQPNLAPNRDEGTLVPSCDSRITDRRSFCRDIESVEGPWMPVIRAGAAGQHRESLPRAAPCGRFTSWLRSSGE